MPKKRNGEIPLPEGWDFDFDFDGKCYFIDHNSQQTSWIDPRDRLTKPATFADCVGNELPVGWEQAYDPLIGVYYIDHINQRTQIEDPHLSWRAYQEAMLRDYLSTASEELKAKKETLDVKTRRLGIAEDEYQHLNAALSGLHPASSTSSLTSTNSGRYDPDLLKQDVSMAKLRCVRLRQELEQIRHEVSIKQQGLQTLSQVEQKLSSGSCYTVGEAQAIMNELRNIQRSLLSGKKERAELMQSLARHKEDLTRLQLQTAESSPDISSLSMLPLEKFSTASQTDLVGELVPLGARLAEMARLRLQYDESRKEVQHIQRRLSELEEKVEPGEVQSDKDRLLLFQEKEQLLRELRSICPKSRGTNEMAVQMEIQRLENDLSHAAEMAKKNIADRLRLHEEKQNLLHKLRDALNSMAALEGRLKSLSASTLSMSSSSSLASLSSSQASSKTSLTSLTSLSFTDIYGTPSSQPDTINMADLHRRVERLLQGSTLYNDYTSTSCDACDQPSSSSSLSTNLLALQQEGVMMNREMSHPVMNREMSHPVSPGNLPLQSLPSLSPRSSLSSVSPPISPYEGNAVVPPPSYEQAFLEKQKKLAMEKPQLEDLVAELGLGDKFEIEKSNSYSALPPLSPISEYVPNEDSTTEESQEDVSHLQGSSSGTNTRSVSAAVSDESVAGDSGVFEASTAKVLQNFNADTAQIQIKLRYAVSDCTLHTRIERARNLSALFIPENHKILIKAALLPNIPGVQCSCSTKPLEPSENVSLGEDFPVTPVPLSKLNGKTLQINVYGISPSAYEHCLGTLTISLADFSPDSSSTKWYNVLSFHFLQMESNTLLAKESDESHTHHKQESDISVTCSVNGKQTKEESSDESTIISSQTSTLTRNQDGDTLHNDVEKWHQRAAEWRCAAEALAETGDEEQDEAQSSDDDLSDGEEAEATEEEVMEESLEHAEEEELVEMEDKSTNTECVFVPTKSGKTPSTSKGIVIKRSQTFSPSAVVNKNEYVCRLNRSDSDSSMPHNYRTAAAAASSSAAFQRGSLERRSLRRRTGKHGVMSSSTSTSVIPPSKHKAQPPVPTVRTSIDLELDRQAQQCRLQSLQEEIRRLKVLKEQLEAAKAAGDSERMNNLLEDERLQNFFQQSQALDPLSPQGKESLKVEKLLKKTSREIYKLRKSRTPRGKPDLVSFKEKMAFFTHPSQMIPLITDDRITEETFSTDMGCHSSSNHVYSTAICPSSASSIQQELKQSNINIVSDSRNISSIHISGDSYTISNSGHSGISSISSSGSSNNNNNNNVNQETEIESSIHAVRTDSEHSMDNIRNYLQRPSPSSSSGKKSEKKGVIEYVVHL